MSRQRSIWGIAVALAAVLGGVLAFWTAQPNEDARVAAKDLGFQLLDREHVARSMDRAAEHHRSAGRRAASERESARVVQRWLDSLAADRAKLRRGIGAAAQVPEARQRLDALAAFAKGIDPAVWRPVTARSTPTADEGDGEWSVDATVHVRLAHPTQARRTVRVPVVVQLAEPVREGGAWRLRDVQIDGPREQLRAYD